MLQIQYFNKGLSKTQIEQIIQNYNLKYTTLTNEINLKLNSIIKTVLNDITPFLENIEYLSNQVKKVKEFENAKNHINILENKLKEKTIIEKDLQNNITYLKQEINDLKEKEKEYERNIKIKDNLINNLENKQNIQSNNYKNKNRKKSLDINKSKPKSSSSLDKLKINKENRTSRNDEENYTNIKNNINTSSKKIKNKNNIKRNKENNKYMMNLKEITRNLNCYHGNVRLTRNGQNINKFISSTTQKEEKKVTKNKKRNLSFINEKKPKKNKEARLSSEIKNISRFEINKNVDEKDIYKAENNFIIQEKKNDNINDERIDEEIKELEIEEQNILDIINKINNFGKGK